MLILPLVFLTGCFAGPFGYDYYDYPEVAYNNINDNNVLRKPPQIGRAKLDNDHVGGAEQGDRMSVGISPTLNGPLLGGMRGQMDGAVDGSVGGNELNAGLGVASGFRDELVGGVRSKNKPASDYVGGLDGGIRDGGGFSGGELNDGSSNRNGGGTSGGGNSDNRGSYVGGDGLGGGDVASDYAGADYAEADAQDYIDLDKQGTSGFLGISEQMGGGFKPIQHQSHLKMSRQIPDQSIRDAAEFGEDYADYADEEIPANKRLSYLGLLDGLHIQEMGDYGQDYADYEDYADDYAFEQFPADPRRSFMGLTGKKK